MAAVASSLVPRRWRRRSARSARLRLTVLYSGMFLVLGTVVVVVIFLVGSASSEINLSSTAVAHPGPTGSVVHVAVSQQHSADVNRVLAGAWVTLVLTAAASAVLGYNVPGGTIEIRTALVGPHAVLSVANTGRSVAPWDIELLFEPFQRLARERTASDRHRGLGLSIVRAIATAHDGTVTAEPRPDGGLVVSVRLPAPIAGPRRVPRLGA